MRGNWKAVAYWVVTGMFAAFMSLSGAMSLTGAAEVRDAMARLGYPPYISWILGPAKLLGVVALLQSRGRTLREWAYAGFTIDLIGAAASHVFSGHPFGEAMVPAVLLLPLAASYALRGSADALPVSSPRRQSPLFG